MKPQKYYFCPGCDQPMLPKGEKKIKDFYDHATGCPLSYAPVYLEARINELQGALRKIEELALLQTTGANMLLIQELAESVLSHEAQLESRCKNCKSDIRFVSEWQHGNGSRACMIYGKQAEPAEGEVNAK